MQFEEFAEIISPILTQSPNAKSVMLAEALNHIPVEDIATTIYLCQGRLGPPAATFRRTKGWPSQSQVLKRLTYQPKITNPTKLPTIVDVYKRLRECVVFDAIAAWSSNYLQQINSLVAGLNHESVGLIALIFAGRIFDDRTILKAMARMSGGGLGADKNLSSLYHKTIPDLGAIAESLRSHGYFSTIILPPQFGIMVPREEITVWEDVQQVWKELRPPLGLFIQGKFFDGIHVQIHKKDKAIKIFNIRGSEVTSKYSHLVEIIRSTISEHEIIIDCEMVGLDPKTRRILPVHRVPDAQNHILAVFDILKLNGDDWRSQPYIRRKAKLEELFDQIEFRRSGIYIPREVLAKNTEEAIKIISEFLEKPHFEGVVIKTPSGIAKTGSTSKDRGRLKPYTVVDSILVGYNDKKHSFMVGLWHDEKKQSIWPYRNVEGVRREISFELSKLIGNNLTRMRPAWIGPGPTPDWYVAIPIVVAVKWDGFVIPNRGKDFAVKWIPHEGATIVGIYPSKEKEANTLSYLNSLKKRDID